MNRILNIEEINEIAEKNYKKKFDNTTSFIDDDKISEVLIKDKSVKVSAKVIRYILGEYIDIKEAYRLKNADLIGNSLDKESLSRALENVYIAWDRDNKTKSILYPYCIFGSSNQIKNLYDEAKYIASGRFKLACFMLEAIALSGTKTGLSLVYDASRKFKQQSVRRTCLYILDDITNKLGMNKEAFADKIIPDFDFNKDGIRIVESEGKKFKITLKQDFSILIFDEVKNKELKTFPKDFPEAQKKELSKLKSEINKVLKTQIERLQLVFMDGRKWSLEEWKEVFINNPIMKTFALKFIWGIYDKENKLLNSFRYMEDGSFNNAEDEEIKLNDDALISLISPIEMNKSLIEKWEEQLSDYEIVQPFNQLSTETEQEIFDKIPNTLTIGSIKSITSKLGMLKEGGYEGIYSYYLLDSSNKISVEIIAYNIYYGSSNLDETKIKIEFHNSNNRFKYGFGLILSSLIK